MQCKALRRPSNVVGALLEFSLVTAGRGSFKKKGGGGKKLLCFASSQLQAERNSSLFPLNKKNIHLNLIRLLYKF